LARPPVSSRFWRVIRGAKFLKSAQSGSRGRCIPKRSRPSLNRRSAIPSRRRLKPATPTVPAPSAKEQNKNKD